MLRRVLLRRVTAKGWQEVPSGGDASVSALGATKTEQTMETWYSGGFGGGWYHRGWWGGPGIATTTIERTPVGTLHVDIFDGNTKMVIWHGESTETLSGDPNKNQLKLQQAVEASNGKPSTWSDAANQAFTAARDCQVDKLVKLEKMPDRVAAEQRCRGAQLRR